MSIVLTAAVKMEPYRIERIQNVRRGREETFRFFADPQNLAALTPEWLHFRFLANPPNEFHAGAEIHYAVRLFGIPITWRSRIVTWEPPSRFIDVQLEGPYSLWRHTHTFAPDDGGTAVGDEIEYAMRFGPIGALARVVLAEPILKQIFDYRAEQMKLLL